MTVLAHVGHWLINLLYAAPVIALVVLLIVDRIRNRGADDEDLEGEEALLSDGDAAELRRPE